MPLDPQAQIVYDAARKAAEQGAPGVMTLPPQEARETYRRMRGPLRPDPPEIGSSEDVTIPTPAGDVPLRYYRPKGAAETDALPVFVYIHGGGWYVGDLDTHDPLCRQFCAEGGFAVLSVGYGLAPEHKFPIGVDQSYAALAWAAAGAGGRAVDGSRLAIAGDSAGGNIAAVVALMARDAGLALAHQSLIYPSTDMSSDDTPSRRELGDDYFPGNEEHDTVRNHYLARPEDATDWRASPLLASDFAGAAPALVITCGYDPLRSEGKAYADKLEAAGVPVVYRCYEGQIHGFLGMGRVIDEANDAVAEIVGAANKAFGA